MNVLFVTNTLYPFLNANSEIAYRLAEVLQREYGCHVTVLGYRPKYCDSTNNPYGVNDFEMREIGTAWTIMARHESRLLKVLRLLRHPQAVSYLLHPEKDPLYRLKTQYRKTIQRLCKKNKYDCVVCFKNPNDTIAAAIEADISIPIIAYELDPWELGSNQSEEELREQQHHLEKNCTAIITTKLLYPTYFNDADGIPIDRVYDAEFPNIVLQNPSKRISFRDGKKHCVFTGQLYGDIRNPGYTIELFSYLTDEGIVLDLFGNDNGCLKNIKMPKNVIYHGEVPSDEAQAYLHAADFVLNIGNTLLNQMPSKILTCLSTGKPILNIVKSENCPTLRYTSRYPYVLDLVEADVVTDAVVQTTKLFFKQAFGQKEDFVKIRELYYEATPEYVGGILYKAMKACVRKG